MARKFVAELDRKSCDDFRCRRSDSSCSRKDEWAERALFDIYDTLLVFAFLRSFVLVGFLNLFRTGVSEGVEDFDIEEGSTGFESKNPFALMSNLASSSVLVDLLSKVSPSNGRSFG